MTTNHPPAAVLLVQLPTIPKIVPHRVAVAGDVVADQLPNHLHAFGMKNQFAVHRAKMISRTMPTMDSEQDWQSRVARSVGLRTRSLFDHVDPLGISMNRKERPARPARRPREEVAEEPPRRRVVRDDAGDERDRDEPVRARTRDPVMRTARSVPSRPG